MDRLGGADGGEVAVALIGKDDAVGQGALEARGDSRRAAVWGLHHIAGKVIVIHNGAADRGDAHGLIGHIQLVEHLGHQTVNNAVGAAGAVVERDIRQRLGSVKHNSHYFAPPTSSLIAPSTSLGEGIMPPVRP